MRRMSGGTGGTTGAHLQLADGGTQGWHSARKGSGLVPKSNYQQQQNSDQACEPGDVRPLSCDHEAGPV